MVLWLLTDPQVLDDVWVLDVIEILTLLSEALNESVHSRRILEHYYSMKDLDCTGKLITLCLVHLGICSFPYLLSVIGVMVLVANSFSPSRDSISRLSSFYRLYARANFMRQQKFIH